MRGFKIWFTSAAGLILAWQLMLPPVVGVANNGDFGKVLGYFGLGAPSEHEFTFADTKYDFDSRYKYSSGFYSSELLLVVPAIAVNRLFAKDQRFDLRWVGLIHGSLLLTAVGLFSPLLSNLSTRIRWAISVPALLIFSDVAYVSYLNSFYMDVASYLFLMLAVVFFLRNLQWRRRIDWVMVLVCSLLLVTSKPQHAVLAIPLALLVFCERRRTWPTRRIALLAAASLLAAGFASLRGLAPRYHDAKGAFSIVFAQILPNAKDQDKVLADLGLDASYRAHIGQVAYSEGTQLDNPQVAAAFLEHASYARLARFFLTHPGDAYQAIYMSLSEAGRQRPVLGNFDSGSGMRPWSQSYAFGYWSRWKRGIFFHHGVRYLLFFLSLIAGFSGVLMYQRRVVPRGAVVGGLMLIVMAALELLVPALADAIDIPRHFLLFYTLCDLLLLAGWYLVIRG